MKPTLLYCFCLLILASIVHAQNPDGLVGYYSFCNCNANDNSGNDNHGMLVGNPSCISGQRGEGFLFNQNPGNNGCGQNGGEYIKLPAFDAIWANGFTVCAWVRFDNIANFERILDIGNESGDAGGLPVWFGREGASNNLTLESWINNNGTLNRTVGRLVAPNVITNGSIEYYSATISGNTMRIYVNGVLKAEKQGHTILNVPRSNNFIGRSNWCFADPDFKGFMDEVRIYNRALSESEINSLFQQTPTFAPFQSPVSPGTSVQLQAQGGTSYQWSPAGSLNNANIPNPIATPLQTTTYSCSVTMADGCIFTESLTIEVLMESCQSDCLGNLGENIFPDGDFGSGVANILPFDPGIAPGYQYTLNPPPGDGFYCLTNNTSTWGAFAATDWIDIKDNSADPNGYMMVVNASNQPGIFYQKTVDVCENTLYEFSMDVTSLLESQLDGLIKPNISFLIDGNVVCETGNIPADEQWRTVRFSFKTEPGQVSVTLALRNNALGGAGNDLAIDNISFRACGPKIILPAKGQFCKGAPVLINATLESSPYSDIEYQWQFFTNGVWQDIPGANSAVINVPSPTEGTLYRLLVANAFSNLFLPSCRAVSDPVILEVKPDLVLDLVSQPVSCTNGSDGSASLNSASGSPPYSYSWSTGANTVTINSLSVGTYTVTISDEQGCTGVGSVFVPEQPPLSASIIVNNLSCNNSATGMMSGLVTGGTSPYSYQWSNGVTSQQANNLPVGLYMLTVTDSKGCTTTISAQMEELPQLTMDITLEDISCRGLADGALNVVASGGLAPYYFLWNTGQSSPDLNGLASGNYQVTLTDAGGCTLVRSAVLQERYIPIASLGPDQVIELGDFVDLSVAVSFLPDEIAEYIWLGPKDSSQCADCAMFRFQPTGNGCHTVVVRDTNGCIASDTFCYQTIPRRRIYVPNAFTPDDDGVNDFFAVFSDMSVSRIIQFSVLDRWGEQVFQAQDIPTNIESLGWDGSYRGDQLVDGVYVWLLEVEFIDGERLRYHGDVTLVR